MKWLKKYSFFSGSKLYAMGSGKSKFEISFQENGEVVINKKKHKIEIIEGSDGFTYIVFGDKKYQAEIIEKNQNKYQVLINGVSYFFTIETPISYKRRRSLDKNQPGLLVKNVVAPMPGKIVDIIVEEDTVIKQGDSLLILEAMKMQNEILSDVSGKIVKVSVNKDDVVAKDALLIEVR